MRLKSTVIVTIAVAMLAGAASAQTQLSAGAGGLFPPGTTFNAVPISGLQAGYGIEIGATGSAIGQFCTLLLAVDTTHNIQVVGRATSATRVAANIVSFSGTCSVNMGDGTTPVIGVPFTATVTTDLNEQGSIGLVIGTSTLPNAVVTAGSMTIK